MRLSQGEEICACCSRIFLHPYRKQCLPRDCANYKFTGSKVAGNNTGLVVLKIFKEYTDNAYWTWRESSCDSITQFIETPELKTLMSGVLCSKKDVNPPALSLVVCTPSLSN